MSEQFYICRVWYNGKAKAARFKYNSSYGGWVNLLAEAKPFASRDQALERLGERSASIFSESEVKDSPYYKAEMKTISSEKPLEVEVLKPAKAGMAPKLQQGDDKAAAKQLNKMFTEAQTGMRKIIALGLFAWELKESKLRHGEFGAWLAANCPNLSVPDSATGKPRASRALSGYMELTKNVLEAAGVKTIAGYLEGEAKCANDAHLKPGAFLLLADKKVPEQLKPLRDKIFEMVDGKSQRQLFLEFKQADEDTGKPKVGRLKGQGGASKTQRVEHAERELQERINEKKTRALEISEWLMEMSDDKGLGEIAGTLELAQLDKAMETARGYIKHQAGGGQ